MNYNGLNFLVFNKYWEYERTITPRNGEYPSYGPTYSLNLNGVIYVGSNDVINKYDKYLNLTKQVSSAGCNLGIYYNPSNDLIYVSSCGATIINVFDQDLNLNKSVTTNYIPGFITGYNGMMVVAGYNNPNITFYQNNSIIQTVTTQCSGRVNSILFDNYNHMLVLCGTSRFMYVHHLNGSYTGLSMSTCVSSSDSTFVNFDSKDRLVITCQNQTEIYY